MSIKRLTLFQLQGLTWFGVFLIIFFSSLPLESVYQAFSFTLINIIFYIIIIYGNIKILYPRIYQTGRKTLYVIYVLVGLIFGGLAKGFFMMFLYNRYFTDHPEPFTLRNKLNFVIAGFLVYMLSFIFRIALAYFEVKQQSERMLAQKSQAELNLLKSQIQPHFLFNTLNNIYFRAYREAPETASLIERLSDIMRYFVDESPKDQVKLDTEVEFIENYVELEKIRITGEIRVDFIKDFDKSTHVPPMLLMPFIENIFKHGIDKLSANNRIYISLREMDNSLVLETRNCFFPELIQTGPGGFGIENLRKRLSILFDDNFELSTSQDDDHFNAFLKIPLK
jgi:sensor histidine kinase YesM